MPRLAAAPRTKGRGKRGQRAGRIVGSLQPAEEAGQGFALGQQAPPDPYRGQAGLSAYGRSGAGSRRGARGQNSSSGSGRIPRPRGRGRGGGEATTPDVPSVYSSPGRGEFSPQNQPPGTIFKARGFLRKCALMYVLRLSYCLR
jgi:hypothetical protein